MTRTLAALTATLAFIAPLGAAEKGWVGEKVMPKKSGLKLGDWDSNDQQKFFEPIEVVYTVTKDKDGWLRVRCPGQEGWVIKTDWVPLADAPAHYTSLIRADPADGWAWNNRGIAWEEMGEYGNAIKDFTETIRLNPGDESGYDNRGNAYKLNKEYDKAIRDYTQALRLKPDNALIYNNRATAYDATGEPDKAIADYTEAIRLDPQYALAYRNRGMTWRTKREYGKAVRDLTEAIRLDPNYTDATFDRGLTYQDAKEYDKAIADYDRILRADPKNVNALNNRGNSYREKKDYDRAMEDYDEALRVDPKYALAYRNRAETWRLRKQNAKAAKDYAQAVRLKPENTDHLNLLAWFLATCPEAEFRDGKKAVECATKACELSEWKDANLIDTLAAACAEAGDFEKAVKYQKQVLAAEGQDKELVNDARKRLALYEQKKPFRLE